jgi:hypothetical protein
MNNDTQSFQRKETLTKTIDKKQFWVTKTAVLGVFVGLKV